MTKDWVATTLGASCELYQPKTISTKEMVEDGEYPVYGANGVIGRYNNYNHEEPQLLVTCRGATCGSVNVSKPFSWITGNAMVVRPRDSSISPRFMEYLLRGGIDVAKAITGAAQPQITRTNLAPVRFSHPNSLSEQQRIVAILDAAFAEIATAKANAEKNLKNARALFESYLNKVFTERGEGWVEKPFGEMVESNVIGLIRNSREQHENLRYPYVKMNNITRDNCFDFSRYTKVDATADEVSRFKLDNGDFLFNTRNSIELVGKVCVYEGSSGDVVLFNNNIMRVRFLPEIDVRYVLHAFSSELVSKNLSFLKSGTTNVAAIYYKDLKSLLIPCAPHREQIEIVVLLDELQAETQRLASIYQQKLVALDELKKSLLHQAFSGAL